MQNPADIALDLAMRSASQIGTGASVITHECDNPTCKVPPKMLVVVMLHPEGIGTIVRDFEANNIPIHAVASVPVPLPPHLMHRPISE